MDTIRRVRKGNIALTFSAINHISPTGILLYFPATTLQIPGINPIAPANEIIGSIQADEFIDENLTNSRILIGLNVDRPYRISPDENGVKISFPKTLDEPVDNEAIIISAETNDSPIKNWDGIGMYDFPFKQSKSLSAIEIQRYKIHEARYK